MLHVWRQDSLHCCLRPLLLLLLLLCMLSPQQLPLHSAPCHHTSDMPLRLDMCWLGDSRQNRQLRSRHKHSAQGLGEPMKTPPSINLVDQLHWAQGDRRCHRVHQAELPRLFCLWERCTSVRDSYGCQCWSVSDTPTSSMLIFCASAVKACALQF